MFVLLFLPRRVHLIELPCGLVLRAMAASLVLCCTHQGAFAQVGGLQAPAATSTPAQAIQEGLRRQEERTREQRKDIEPKGEELSPEAEKRIKSPFPQESVCFTINELQLAGPDASRFAWLVDTAVPYLRRCVGVKGLGYIATELDARLRELGYVTTRVVLPSQNLQSGKLVIQINAGRAADIRMVQGSGSYIADERWGTWRNAFPVSRGDVLNIRDIEQGVENMKRLSSQAVTTRMEPGEEPGTSLVYVERKTATLRERTRVGISIDNSGSPALGRTQLAANLAFENPAGLNDILSASFNTNAEQPTSTHRSQSASVNYSVPWGYSLLTLSASNSRFAQNVQGTTVRFLSSGRSQSAEARLQHTLWRSSSAKLGVYGSISTRRAISYLDDVEIIVQRRRTTNVETGISYRQLFESSTIDLDLGLKRGVPWHRAQDDFITAADGGLTLRPKIFAINAAYATDFTLAQRHYQYSSTLRGQHTKNTTLSVDQISIGGRSSVRGFDGDSVLLAENGLVLRNEVSTPLKTLNSVETAAYLAVDYGRVWGPSDFALVGKRLIGLALGLKGRWRATNFNAALSTPLSLPEGFSSSRLNVYLSATQSF
jgi:hemolysin activation/secretion protein